MQGLREMACLPQQAQMHRLRVALLVEEVVRAALSVLLRHGSRPVGDHASGYDVTVVGLM